MNADSLAPSNGPGNADASQPAPRPDKDAAALQRRAAFEALLANGRHLAQGALVDESDAGADMGSAALCSECMDMQAACDAAQSLRIEPLGYGMTYGMHPAVTSRRGAGVLVTMPSGLGLEARRRSKAAVAATEASANSTSPELVEQWIRELARSVGVAEKQRADTSAVTIELKGSLLGGTGIVISRHGHRLHVGITAATRDGFRELRSRLPDLQGALAAAAPECALEVSLQER